MKQHNEMHDLSANAYAVLFEAIESGLLNASLELGMPIWRAAVKRFSAPRFATGLLNVVMRPTIACENRLLIHRSLAPKKSMLAA